MRESESPPPPPPPPLEEIVRRLEGEELDLDEALKLFEEGVVRLRDARQRLAQAEATVKKVLGVENLDR